MKHLSDEELYALSQHPEGGFSSHLRECEECAARFHEFLALLENAAAGAACTPRPAADLGDRVWSAIRPSLPVYGPGMNGGEVRGRRSSRMFAAWWSGGLVWARAFAALVLIGLAFWAGRLFEQQRRETNPPLKAASQPGRVVLLVVRDHLDRSERLLVELDHAGHLPRGEGGPLAREAADLLENNHLYRQTAAASQDPALAQLLDRLGRVLVEVAHEPAELQSGDVARLREQMNLDGLLFELRVVRDRRPKVEKENKL
jgi:hypothetical protein